MGRITPEGRVKAETKAFLRSIGAYYFMPVQTGYGATSLDLLVCYRGRFVGIETKRQGVKRGTPLQEAVIQLIRQSGGVAFVADNLETVKNEFAKIDAAGKSPI